MPWSGAMGLVLGAALCPEKRTGPGGSGFLCDADSWSSGAVHARPDVSVHSLSLQQNRVTQPYMVCRCKCVQGREEAFPKLLTLRFSWGIGCYALGLTQHQAAGRSLGTWTPSLCVWKGQAGDTEASPGPGQLEAELGLDPCPGSEAPRSPLRMSQG